MIKKAVKKIFPPHTKTGRIVKKVAVDAGLARPNFFSLEYQHWMQHIEPEIFLPVQKIQKREQPLFSIVIPFFNTPEKYLHALLDSVLNQSYGDWELIVGDGSTDKERSVAIKSVSERDARIKYHHFTKNTDISGNTNQTLEHASGEYVVFCDHDDVLSPHALNEVAAVLHQDESIDIIYSDEDKLSDNGKWRHSPFFKPDWSPHLFLQTNYTNHLSVVRRTLVEKAGGLRTKYNGAQDYDLLLRIHGLDSKLSIHHIDKILYHWREADGSTAANFSSKSYAFQAGKKALQGYLDSQKINGTTEIIEGKPGFYRQVLQPDSIKKVVVLVAVSDDSAEREAVIEKLRIKTISSVLKIDFVSIEPKLLDSHSTSKYDAVFEFKVVAYPQASDWLDRLVGVLELENVYEVAPRITSADGVKVTDMGIVRDSNDNPINLHHGHKANDMTLNGHTEWVRDVDELSSAVRGYRTTNRQGAYSVVWSHVDFRYYPVFGKQSFFNSNLRLLDDGKVVPNE